MNGAGMSLRACQCNSTTRVAIAREETLMRETMEARMSDLDEREHFVTSIQSLLDGGDSVRDWVVEGLIESSSLMLLIGPPKSYKSLLAQHFAVAIASGTDALQTFRVPQQRNVIYVQEESSLESLRRRFKSLLAGQGIDRQLVHKKLYFVTNKSFLLDDKQHIESIRRAIERV